LLRHRHDAEDVAQEVFLRIFRSLGRWDSTRPLRPWVLGITVNRCRTAMSKRRKRAEPTDYLADLPDTELPALSPELNDALSEYVAELRDEYREVFVLYHETGSSYEEIAAMVNRPVGTVKTWLHRARQMLHSRLQQRGLIPDKPEPAPQP
jgi:RNA polymerase sigma-70 factor (ECF subfamily)